MLQLTELTNQNFALRIGRETERERDREREREGERERPSEGPPQPLCQNGFFDLGHTLTPPLDPYPPRNRMDDLKDPLEGSYDSEDLINFSLCQNGLTGVRLNGFPHPLDHTPPPTEAIG